MTERLHFHFTLSSIGEGNGHPLQCSCLENPRDGGACWAAAYGAAQSQTRLKQLSSNLGFTERLLTLYGMFHSTIWILGSQSLVLSPGQLEYFFFGPSSLASFLFQNALSLFVQLCPRETECKPRMWVTYIIQNILAAALNAKRNRWK